MSDEEKGAEEAQGAEETGQEQAAENAGDDLSTEEQYEVAQEEQARSDGWKPLDEFIEGGGEVKNWVKADAFNVRAGLVGELRRQKKIIAGFDGRLAGVNQVHAAQLEVQKKDLTEKRDAAALQGGEEGLEIVKNAQHQLDKLQEVDTTAVQQVSPELETWNEQNPWINQPGAKATYAQSLFAGALNQGGSIVQAIAYVNQEISKEFPTQQRSKPQVSETEKGSKPGGFKRQDKKLSMSDISPEEKKWRAALPGAWKTEDEFLQAVKDARAK